MELLYAHVCQIYIVYVHGFVKMNENYLFVQETTFFLVFILYK